MGDYADSGMENVSIDGSEITRHIHDRLTSIQYGRAEDPHGWMYRLA